MLFVHCFEQRVFCRFQVFSCSPSGGGGEWSGSQRNGLRRGGGVEVDSFGNRTGRYTPFFQGGNICSASSRPWCVLICLMALNNVAIIGSLDHCIICKVRRRYSRDSPPSFLFNFSLRRVQDFFFFFAASNSRRRLFLGSKPLRRPS